jgi:hypothetical protein
VRAEAAAARVGAARLVALNENANTAIKITFRIRFIYFFSFEN